MKKLRHKTPIFILINVVILTPKAAALLLSVG